MGETTEQAECHIHSRELEILENVFNVLLKLCVCVCVCVFPILFTLLSLLWFGDPQPPLSPSVTTSLKVRCPLEAT